MKIAWFTEGGWHGKVDRNHPNMRTDMAWVCSLKADHNPIHTLHTLPDNHYDLGIMIVPKKKRSITLILQVFSLSLYLNKYSLCCLIKQIINQ